MAGRVASGTASGDNGVYDVAARTVTLTGKVVLKKEKNVMSGTRLVVNLITGKADFGAQAAPGAAPSRVQGVFTPTPSKSD